MATYESTVSKFGDRIIDMIGQADDLAVKAASAVTERLDGMLPEKLPGAEVLSNLPKPEEYVRLYWSFVERLVKTQRAYTMNLVKAFEPINRRIWAEPKVRKAAA
ncbi:MAG: hypothetical protein ACRDI0_06025 [Actinomycetota bacterium]